jgi:DNA-binding beta-propeller fold protein YncE
LSFYLTPGTRDPLFHGAYLYVASEYTNQVLRFNASTGAFVDVFVAAGTVTPIAQTFGPDGNLYVVDSASRSVVRYNGTTGQSLGTFVAAGSGGLSSPAELTFDSTGSYLYVASSGSNQVLKYNAQTGAFVGVAASAGLASPADVMFGSDGLLYVLSSGNNRILRYNANGVYVDDYVPAGSGGMVNPYRMAFGSDGDLYVSAFGTPQSRISQIMRFGPENEALFTITNTTASTLPLTVNYATADGSAVAGTNYTATSGTFTFAPGVTSDTIRVPLLDSGSQTTALNFTLTLSNPEAATLSRGQATGTSQPSDQKAKFYVVNGPGLVGGNHDTFKYQASGTEQAPYSLSLADLDPIGVAANAAGTEEWVVDRNETVYAYSPGGTLLGSWSAGGLPSGASLNGIATDGTNIWLLDATSNKVFEYAGAASRLSGSQNAASSFKLNKSDAAPSNLVTDGKSLWVVDQGNGKVFKYTVAGSLLGSWTIDPADVDPVGITINPNNVSDVWIVDGYTLKVYDYTAAASRTSGKQNAAASFALAAGNTNPVGIADPPPADLPLPPTAAPLALNLPTVTGLDAGSSVAPAALTGGASPAGRDAAFAQPVRGLLPRLGESTVALLAGGALTPRVDSPRLAANRLSPPAPALGGEESTAPSTPLTPENGQGLDLSAAGPADGPAAGEDSPASAVATDAFFAGLADDVLADE